MAFPYKMHSQAIEEYANAYDWYESAQKGLGEHFATAIDDGVNEICCNPALFSKLRGSYRQARIKKFPFVVVYEFFPRRKMIHIAAIFHTSRSPRKKFRREENIP